MRFTAAQYDQAILALTEAKTQLEPDAKPCAICSDSGHMAFECGHNPLLAMSMCREIAQRSDQLHGLLHHLAGYDFAFGEQQGPAKVVLPEAQPVEQAIPATTRRREFLGRHMPLCPNCNTEQVQLTGYFGHPPASWRCRKCGCHFDYEPDPAGVATTPPRASDVFTSHIEAMLKQLPATRRPSTQHILDEAKAFVERKRAEGWTRADFADALQKLFEETPETP